ncbi:phage tail assembly protein [Paenibacillus macquariensis]|uniref:Phage tail assembly chaperone protein, E, or 41 or 14 n=1 Tax=Paenibacillus macquariensis TaxID=948756 RepID=A0ABY1K767_9BACL|nr:phage tail assembly protein [Paenibacillus macquariensis]MEC0092502.1 phage tail assembly protein [Paenibacillus macquariensis]OAB35460.1 hypothetical protein PMSM_09395 [Paenibacillus macquariensis subsp. macquariensis]SIR35299.1 Phage tail assembly chaperone protein, E, or 41 or 14 [Paenibacillus macquariensis]
MNEQTEENISVNEVGGRAYKLSRPFTYEDKEYKEIKFDFEKLTGDDIIACESEMYEVVGSSDVLTMMMKETHPGYQTVIAAKAASLHFRIIKAMPAKDFIRVTKMAQRFLLGME